MTGAGVKLARISAGSVATLDIDSIGTKPLPLPPSRKGRGRIKGWTGPNGCVLKRSRKRERQPTGPNAGADGMCESGSPEERG